MCQHGKPKACWSRDWSMFMAGLVTASTCEVRLRQVVFKALGLQEMYWRMTVHAGQHQSLWSHSNMSGEKRVKARS